jgi:hypothetical protein
MKLTTMACSAALFLLAAEGRTQDDFFYPPATRTEAQQKQDRFECHEWAVAQSRFDPVEFAARTPSAPAKPAAASKPDSTAGNAGRTVVGSAAAGAAIGEAADNDAGKGAAIGGAAGLLRARMAEKKAEGERAAAQMNAQAAAQRTQASEAEQLRTGRDAYQRARATCFKGRGYTVSE